MEKIYNFSDEQKKRIKRNWLISAILFQLVLPFIINFLTFQDNPLDHSSKGNIIGSIYILIVSLLCFWVIFHCAYRKQGTRLLTIGLVISPFYWIGNIIESMVQHIPIMPLIFCSVFFVWWYINCLYLKRLNKELKRLATIPNR
jgi:hypothetical protein